MADQAWSYKYTSMCERIIKTLSIVQEFEKHTSSTEKFLPKKKTNKDFKVKKEKNHFQHQTTTCRQDMNIYRKQKEAIECQLVKFFKVKFIKVNRVI